MKKHTERSLKDILLAGAKEGNLLHVIQANRRTASGKQDEIACVLAELHNERLVDVVATFAGLKHNVVKGPNFFSTRRVLEKALPHMDAPIAPVMHCVLGLFHEAGQDMMAGSILGAYSEFCTKDAARPREALELIKADPGALADMLAATITAGSQLDSEYYLSELLCIIRHPDINIRRHAVSTVARFHWAKGEGVPNTVITTIEETVASEDDDRILAGVVESAFALFEQDNTLDKRINVLIGTALAKGDEHTLHMASELFWRNTNELPSALLELLLTHLKQVKPENIGTLNNIDYGIAHLLKREDPEQGLQFLEELLAMHRGDLNVELFDSAISEISGNAALISKILTRWFLRGERVLCEAIHTIAGSHYGDNLHIEVDASELNLADHIHILFLARKAVGYFFMSPITAASVVISLMRLASSEETLKALGELLFDPLLLNYTGNTYDYVEKQVAHESGKAKETIEKALSSIEQYLTTLRAVPKLPALSVSQSQRETYSRQMSESMAESMKEAEKDSILTKLCSRSTLLYGNKSINYIYSGDGEPRRMEIPLTKHGVTMEFPRMDNIDPYGLDFMLRVFRNERFRT